MSSETCVLEKPASAVHWLDPWIIAALIIVIYACPWTVYLNNNELIAFMVAVIFGVMMFIEYRRSPWPKKERPRLALRELVPEILTKLIGGFIWIGIVIVGWTVISEYTRFIYIPFFQIIDMSLPAYILGMVGLICFTEWRIGPNKDSLWQFGRMAMGHLEDVQWDKIRHGLFSILVKGFFLPLNISAAVVKLSAFRGKEMDIFTLPWPKTVMLLDNIIFFALVVSIIPGYMFESRLFGTSIKKVEQSWFGWMVTLFCYPPINRGTGSGWFTYNHGTIWPDVFGNDGPIAIAVGSALIVFYLIHYWAESICCMRSSHLTSRGLFTSGPFALSKHPVYVVKFFAWGLALLPFLSGKTVMDNIRYGLAFVAFAVVYVMRGWMEERLMSSDDPDYIKYGLWMDKHSLFRFVGKWFPPASYEWRLNHWRAKGLVPPPNTPVS